MIRPLKNAIKSQKIAFFIVGFVMLICLMVHLAITRSRSGWSASSTICSAIRTACIWAAVAMNIFGHGMGFVWCFFIQGRLV
jgi:hypothetical protein